MHILTARWTEPCSGSAAWTVDLTDEEADRLQDLLDWLQEHAGDDYGDTLVEWDLDLVCPICNRGSRVDLESFDAVLDQIALDSRYNETDNPGEYYGARNPLLDGR